MALLEENTMSGLETAFQMLEEEVVEEEVVEEPYKGTDKLKQQREAD